MNENQSSETIFNIIVNIFVDVMQKWQVILMIAVLCAVAYDSVLTLTYVPQYKCEATFSVQSNQTETTDTEDSVGTAFSYIFKSNIFKTKMKEALNVEQLQGTYSASMKGSTNVLQVYAISPSIKTSYDMMNALVHHYQDVSRLVVGTSNIELLDDINIPNAPYNVVNHKRNLVLAGGIGAIAMIGIFSVLSFLKNTVKSKEDMEKLLDIKLLGVIPREKKKTGLFKKNKNAILITQASTSFHFVETMKKIRSKIEKFSKDNNAKVILITSSLENEGKSTVSSNIALSLAMSHHKVLLIDGDLRKPSLHLIFKENSEYGINHVLSSKKSLLDCIVHMQNYNLDILLANDNNDSEYFDEKEFEKLVEEAKTYYDYIIIDSAPAHLVLDTKLMCSYADGIILTIKQNYANLGIVEDTVQSVTETKTPIIGGLLTYSYSSYIHHNKYYGYKYGYGYGYGYRRKRKGGDE